MIGWVISVVHTDLGFGPVTMAWAAAAPTPEAALEIVGESPGAGRGPFDVLCMLSETAVADLGLKLGEARPI